MAFAPQTAQPVMVRDVAQGARRPHAGLILLFLAWAVPASPAQPTPPASAPDLSRLDSELAAHPDDLSARAERAEILEAAGAPMLAFSDRREILRHHPDDADAARLAAYDLLSAGAPGAASALVAAYPAAVTGGAGAALEQRIEGDVAARRVRWGWAEPVFDPAQGHHEAAAAIAILEPMHRRDPANARAAGDLLLAYRLAGRMSDAVALWESTLRSDTAPYWLRNAAADAYLALHGAREAEALYRSFARERAAEPQPWLGIYWAAIDQHHFAAAGAALDELAKIPGQQRTADVQRGWLLLFAGRVAAGRTYFEQLFTQYPGDDAVREGLATAYLWEGWPRRGLRALEELLARTTLDVPRVDRPSARIARAGAWLALGDLAAAHREARDLAALYPDNLHAQRLDRDVDTALAPEARLDTRYDTSDRGLGETWAQLEASLPRAPAHDSPPAATRAAPRTTATPSATIPRPISPSPRDPAAG